MSATSSVTAVSSAPSDLKYMDMEEEVSSSRGTKPTMESLSRTSRHFGSSQKYDADPMEDADSGVFNSSKYTAGSISDNDLVDPSEVRIGHFDYFDGDSVSTVPRRASISSVDELSRNSYPTTTWQTRAKGEQERLNDQAYDASFDADTDIDIQADAKDGMDIPPAKQEIEMETYKQGGYLDGEMTEFQKKIHNEYIRKKNNDTYDEAHCNDSDNSCEDLQSVVVHSASDDWTPYNVHKSLYNSRANASCYSRMDSELNEDDPEFASKSSLKKKFGSSSGVGEKQILFRSSPNYGATRAYNSSAASRSVDSAIGFPLGNSSRNTSSDRVKIDKTVKSRDQQRPPFGDPLVKGELFRSAERLIDGRGNRSDVQNLPKAAPINQAMMLESRGSSLEDPEKKEKKKKKKKSKDDGDLDQDENGNPVVERDVTKLTPWSSSFPRDLSYFNSYSKDPDDTMSPALDAQPTKKARRRNAKRKEDATFKASALPGNIGHKSVTELLSYIDGANGSVSANNKKIPSTNKRQEQSDRVPPSNNRNEQDRSLHSTGRNDQDKNVVLVAACALSTNHIDLNSDSFDIIQKGENKGKKTKKKGKNSQGGSKGSSEVDDKSSRTSEVDIVEKLQDTFTETQCDDTSFSSDLKETNHSTPAISSTKNFCSSEEDTGPLTSLEQYTPYIFTDFDTKFQKEEQFQTVTKRKKKPVLSSKEFERDYMSETRREDGPFRRRNRPLHRSYTPPPINSSTNQEKPNERALSPSAFPVLSNNRDARRNSTGNVSELGCGYDSDLDSSVKSVPVSGLTCDSARLSGDIISTTGAGYKQPSMSYASITAGGKSAQCGSGSTSSQDGDQYLTTNVSAALTIDATSDITTEEHFTLNLPSDNIQNSIDITIDMVLEPGVANMQSRPSSASSISQCTITELSQTNVSATYTYPIPSAVDSHACQVESSVEATITYCPDTTHPSEKSTDASITETSQPSKDIDVNDRGDFPALHQSKCGLPSSKTADQAEAAPVLPQPVSSVSVPTNNSRPVPGSINSVTSSPSVSVSNTATTSSVGSRVPATAASKPPQAPKNSIHKSKNKALKSVVFLDKKMNDGPKHLDISFGFEPDLDSSVISSNARLDSSSTCSSDSGRGTDNDSFLHGDKADNNNIENSPVSLDNRTAVNASGVIINSHPLKNSQLTNVDLAKNDNNNQLIFMAPEQSDMKSVGEPNRQYVMPVNGLIVPASVCKVASHPDLTAEKNRINAANVQKSLARTDVVDNNTSKQSEVTLPQEKSNVKLDQTFVYDKEDDPNFQVGQFNYEAGVTLLYNEWQKVHCTATVYDEGSSVAC